MKIFQKKVLPLQKILNDITMDKFKRINIGAGISNSTYEKLCEYAQNKGINRARAIDELLTIALGNRDLYDTDISRKTITFNIDKIKDEHLATILSVLSRDDYQNVINNLFESCNFTSNIVYLRYVKKLKK